MKIVKNQQVVSFRDIVKWCLVVAGLAVLFVIMIASRKEQKKHETRTELNNVIQRLSVDSAKAEELNPTLATSVNEALDSTFTSYSISTIKMFGNNYKVTKLNSRIFRIVYKKDTVILKRLNDTRIEAMNLSFIYLYIDEINEIYECE